MHDWVFVTNRILDGTEIMLIDNFYPRPRSGKKRSWSKEVFKVTALVLYYGVRFLT
jgi:hypothetical protein